MIRRAEFGDRRFESLTGEKNERRFQDCERQSQERNCDQTEFDGGGTILLPDKAARQTGRH